MAGTEETSQLVIASSTPVPLVMEADGVVRVGHTRVTLDTVIAAFHEGATAEEIVAQYPVLSLADVYAVIGYYLQQQTAIDAYLSRRQQVADQVRRHNEARCNPCGIRERLLARRRQASAANNDPATG
jgi:uncharacterized protein (DUF433 family)